MLNGFYNVFLLKPGMEMTLDTLKLQFTEAKPRAGQRKSDSIIETALLPSSDHLSFYSTCIDITVVRMHKHTHARTCTYSHAQAHMCLGHLQEIE